MYTDIGLYTCTFVGKCKFQMALNSCKIDDVEKMFLGGLRSTLKINLHLLF